MADKNKIEKVKEVLAIYLKAHNMRNTPERNATLEAAYNFVGPFTIDILLPNISLPLSRTTVYNNLETLSQAGLVLKHPIGGGAVEYEACYEKKAHHHIICTMCGSVAEFADDSIEQFVAQKRFSKFRMNNCVLNVYGVCRKCQTKINREKRKQNKNKK